jgi:glycosyltransferase involved in cell wall biosynthesis
MKVLTNIRFAQTAGIAQVVLAFMDFIEASNKNNINVVAVNICDEAQGTYNKKSGEKTSTISVGVRVPNIAKVVEKSKTLADVEKKLEPIIKAYQKAIQEEKPDLALVNGTYFMPWCLMKAAERENIPAVLHYHGVLTKETQNWKKHPKELFYQMEKSFDKKDLFYIFPSQITKTTVEKEVFGHKIKKFAILPNPVSDYFFEKDAKEEKKNIGIVSRWAGIKNVKFCEKLAEYNQKRGAKFVVNVITDLDTKNKKYKELSKVVTFHKPTSNKKLASFYRNMGVVISPSHFETYGNVAKEALATGTPAIVNPNMGVAETFDVLGLKRWVINFDSVKSVYNKIESVIGETVNTETREKMKRLYVPPKIFNQIISILMSAAA